MFDDNQLSQTLIITEANVNPTLDLAVEQGATHRASGHTVPRIELFTLPSLTRCFSDLLVI
jgi:hypothetical protein